MKDILRDCCRSPGSSSSETWKVAMSGKLSELKILYIHECYKSVKHFIQMMWQNRLVIGLGNAEIPGAETSSKHPVSGILTCLQCS